MKAQFSFEYIEDYLAGKLEEKAQIEFEQQLLSSPELVQLVQDHQEAHKAVHLYSKIRLKEKVAVLQAKEQNQSTSGWNIMRIAAALAFIGVLFTGYLIADYSYSDATLAAGHFEPYPNRFTTMGDKKSDPFNKALTFYDKHDYESALLEFGKVPISSENYLPAQIYLGIAYFSLEQYDLALDAFNTAYNHPGNYREVAQWYLALCYLNKHDIANARPLFEQIVAESSYKVEKAQEILKKLDSPIRKLPGIER